MRKQFSLLLLLLLPMLAVAQSALQAPKNVYFADIHIKLSDGAQQEVQKRIDYLHKNPKFLMMRVDLADSYFPVIERTFKEEGVPDDFKYLALMESDLIGDAVSTSNAVGYWQFKREAAADFNLIMNNNVDERRHIIEASRGAARYFKRSNNFYDNWLNTLLSYYEGYTGAKAYTKPSDKSSKRMELTEKSHPYLLKFTAYKIAYESYVGKNSSPTVSLREMRATPGQSLADIAMATQTDYAELERYNKWLLGSSVPADKDYLVMIPIRNQGGGLLASNIPASSPQATPAYTTTASGKVQVNNLNAIIARKGDTKDKLALQAGLSTRQFLKYNDLRNFDEIVAGNIYYTESKRNRSSEAEYHVVKAGETMQGISQQYGVKLSFLLFNNRMGRAEAPVTGRVLWLHKRRPHSTPIEVRNEKQAPGTTAPVLAKNTPSAAPAKVATASTTKARTTEPEAKKENIFTRFINSLKRKKQEPAETETKTAIAKTRSTPAAEPAKPVVEDEDIFVTPAEAAPVQKQATAQKTAVEEQSVFEEKKAEEPKPKTGTLYPGNRSVPPAPASPPKEVKAEEQNETRFGVAVTEEATTELAIPQDTTLAALPEETFTSLADTSSAYVTIIEEKPAPVKPAPVATTPKAKEPVKAAPEKAKEEYVAYEAETEVAPAPAKPKSQQPATKHVVKQGETLYSISRMYAVSINDISNWNSLGEDPIKIGQELLIAEPLTMPENTSSETAAAAPSMHTVSAGESLYKIAKKYDLTIENLRQWNNLSSSNLSIGQQLLLTAPAETESTSPAEPAEQETTNFSGSSTYHTVQSGESMYQISRKYGVTIKDIMEWNKKSNFDVSLGEKLLIKKK